MKKIKNLIIGVVVLALLIGAYFLVTELTKEEPVVEEEPEEIVVVDDSLTDEVYTIGYSNASGEVNFTKGSGYWVYPGDSDMPVDQEFVDTMAQSLIKITALRDITGQGDESAYGFEEPTLTLTVGTRGAKTHVYTVGAYNEMSQGYYLKFEDKVYVIDSTIIDATSYRLLDAVAGTELAVIDSEKITALTVNGEAGNTEGYSNVGIVKLENYKDKESYGFDGTENKVVVTYTETSEVTDEAGNVTSSVDTERSYSFSYVETDEGYSYIMLPDDNNIYSATGLEKLTAEAETEE